MGNTAMSGIDWFETTGLYAAGDSVVDWVGDTSNWEALGKTLLSSTLTGFSGDWEGGWDMFTDSSMYYGNTYDEIEALQAQAEAYEELMAEIANTAPTSLQLLEKSVRAATLILLTSTTSSVLHVLTQPHLRLPW